MWYGFCVKMTYIVNPEEVDDEGPDNPEDSRCDICIKKTKAFFQPIYKIVSSHFGLITVLVAYTFMGGAMFAAIEGPHEVKEKHDIIASRESIIQSLWNESLIQHIWNSTVNKNDTGHILDDQEFFTEMVRGELRLYEEQLRVAFAHGVKSDSEEKVWDFWGATLYSATIYTTIGYGHIAPVTTWGRIATMFYAIFGVPLCLVVLADLGVLFTRAVKYVWAFIRRFYYTGSFRKIRKLNQEQFVALRRKLSGIAAREDSDTLSDSDLDSESESESEKLSIKSARSVKAVEEAEIYKAYDVDGEFNLPPAVAIIITVTYILLGAAMYTSWEPWGFLEAFYFVFISISTIGFGDVVPEHTKFFLASSIYILIGLSLVAMVVNVFMVVVKDTVSKAEKKLQDVTQKIGIHISVEDILETSSMKSEELKTEEGKLPIEDTPNDIRKSATDTLKVPTIDIK